jgi:FixJ family two-component response regulator
MPNVPSLIAIVDDEESVRKALQRLIRSAGFAVETFPSGAEFLESMARHQPDCLVLDLHMPQVNGFEVQVRLNLAGVRVPVVVITGHDTPEARARTMDQGAKAYLRKPVDDLALLAAINEAIAGAGEPSRNARHAPKGNGL